MQQREMESEKRDRTGIGMFLLKSIPAVFVGVLSFVGFVLQLGGVGNLHRDCSDESDFSTGDCHDQFRFVWWTSFFQIIVVVLVGLVTAVGKLNEARLAVLLFIGISTLQVILGADRFLGNDIDDSQRTAAAGFIFSAMANFLLILGIGVPEIPLAQIPQSALTRGFHLSQTRAVETASEAPRRTNESEPQHGIPESSGPATVPVSTEDTPAEHNRV